MGVRSEVPSGCHPLTSADGELVCVRVSVEPRFLEDLLECLASASFPINPQIYHGRPTTVEFPAYDHGVDEVRLLLHQSGFTEAILRTAPILDTLSTV
jgi:hypothetical protein